MGDRRDGQRVAIQTAARWFGLSGKPEMGPMRLAVVLVVLGALLMVAPARSVVGFIGAALWVVGVVIALRGWFRLMRLRAKSK
jgi:hypothetical protein